MGGWADLALFLALFRERSTVRAAASLGISQPTVVRRLAALEERLGLHLFERMTSGLMPTQVAIELLPLAEEAERVATRFHQEADHLAGRRQDRIKLTFLDHFEHHLVPVLREFRASHPGVKVELLATDRMYDLAKGEADIALRGASNPESDEILARALPPSGWTIFAPVDWVGPLPADAEAIKDFPIVLPEGAPARLPIYAWLARHADAHATRCTGYGALRSAVASGAGLTALPLTIGDGDAGLRRCFGPLRQFDVPIYIAAPRSALRRQPVRDLFELLYAFLHANAHLLRGRD